MNWLKLKMKAAFPALHISVNGGITGLDQVKGFLAAGGGFLIASEAEAEANPRSRSAKLRIAQRR